MDYENRVKNNNGLYIAVSCETTLFDLYVVQVYKYADDYTPAMTLNVHSKVSVADFMDYELPVYTVEENAQGIADTIRRDSEQIEHELYTNRSVDIPDVMTDVEYEVRPETFHDDYYFDEEAAYERYVDNRSWKSYAQDERYYSSF